MSGRKLRGTVTLIEYLLAPKLLETDLSARMGVSVSRRYGSACLRNAFKRRAREAFRLIRPSLPPNLELNITPNYRQPLPSTALILEDLQKLIHAQPPTEKSR